MKKIVRITEADVKRILKKLSDKDFEDEFAPFENPGKHGFTHMDQNMLSKYVETFGPITLIGGKYACQNRKGQWLCYDKYDRVVSDDKIMSEFDLTKYGFNFGDFVNSYVNK
jgi:hypothetical protein